MTPEQSRAVRAGDCSVALSAGAGCGKTFVLTERFLSGLEACLAEAPDGDPQADVLSRLVAITFTDKAAREMRDRIRRACQGRLLAAPDDGAAARWQAVLRDLDAARVSTFHSFCAAFLRAHAVEAGLDPRFATIDAIQAATLASALVGDHLRRHLIDQRPEATDLVVRFGLEPTASLLSAALAARDKFDFAAWAARSPDEVLDAWEDFHRRVLVPAAVSAFLRRPPLAELLVLLRDHPPASPKMRQRRDDLVDIVDRLSRRFPLPIPRPPASKNTAPDPQVTAVELEALREGAMVKNRTKLDWPDPEDYDRVKTVMEEVRKAIDGLLPVLTFDKQSARPAAECGLRLAAAAVELGAAYQEHKQREGLLDFDDLIAHTRRLLCGPGSEPLCRRVADAIQLLLVDESQDTDPGQVELLEALCGDQLAGGKLFVVGDFKQSIYRFRGADPAVFRDLRLRIPPAGRLPLTRNFRSQPAIINFVNALFAREFGEDYEPLVPSRRQLVPEPAVEFLWATADSSTADAEGAAPGDGAASEDDEAPAGDPPGGRKQSAADLRQCEARWIARRLRALLDTGEKIVCDRPSDDPSRPPAPRALRPGDVAILFRSLSDVALYEAALREHGLDYYLVGGKAFYAQQEVFDLLNLLRAIDSPLDEVALAGALRSPFFALSDEAFYWLVTKGGGLAAGLFAADLPPELSECDRQRAEFAAATLRDLRRQKDRHPVAALVQLALARTGYDAALLAEFLGERKLANLRKLVDQARSLDRTGLFSLSDFITQLAEFVANEPDEPLAATHPEGTDVVRLMTIHQAKGLEFPLVVVPDLERRPPGNHRRFAFRPDLGPLVKLKEDDDGTPINLCGFDLYARFEALEDDEEAIRLLYVAATRAADYLILSSGVEKADRAKSVWRRLLARCFDLATGEPRERPAGGLPRVRVTAAVPPWQGPSVRGPRRDVAEAILSVRDAAAAGRVTIARHVGPLPADNGARRQYSFSRLSGGLRKSLPPPDDVLDRPAAVVDPLQLGTLVHECLAALPLGRAADVLQQVAPLVHARAVRRGIDAPAERAEAAALVERFLASPRAADLSAARQVHRELEFLLAWPPGGPPAGGEYFQGFVDCLYQDSRGAWHVVDFKTNQVAAATLDAVAAAYEMQMLVYGLAAERALGVAPASMTLHFLRTGAEVPFMLDDAARRRAVELVNLARAELVAPGEAARSAAG
jgi:ATP-dependent helicase/nuclease subunit A